MTGPNPEDYRPCVGIMLLNPKGEVFIARRIDTRSEAWQMPQGGIDAGESPEDAAFRELMEEIGTARARVLMALEDWYYYDLPEELQPQLWGGQFKGQRQKWFALAFEGMDSEVNIETEVPEFCEWRWEVPSRLPELIVPFKKALYADVVEAFRPCWEPLQQEGIRR